MVGTEQNSSTGNPAALRVDLKDYDNNTAYANYSSFYIGGSSTDYTLQVSGYSGTAGDGLAYHNGHKFSTKDNDNDVAGDTCAVIFSGAWWYGNCANSHLNGLYYSTRISSGSSNFWATWQSIYSLKFNEMKLHG